MHDYLRQDICKLSVANYTFLLNELPFSVSSKIRSPMTLTLYIFARLSLKKSWACASFVN